MPDRLRAITLTQPWATLVALGAKRLETRSWSTTWRGPLAIHAGKSMPCRLGETLTLGRWTVERDRGGLLLRGPISHPYRLPQGAIVATVELTDCQPTDGLLCNPDDDERALGNYGPGRYAWTLDEVATFGSNPVPAVGALGLWTPGPELIAAIKRQLVADCAALVQAGARISGGAA